MGKTPGVCLLVLLITTPAGAGVIQNETPKPPQSKPVSDVQEPATGGAMRDGATYGLTPITLAVLAALPSLF